MMRVSHKQTFCLLLLQSSLPCFQFLSFFSKSCIAALSVTLWSLNLLVCLAFVLYCIETVCVTQIMRADLCGISQLFQAVSDH